MKHVQSTTKKSRLRPIAVLRAAIQIASFFLVPGLFITLFYAPYEIVSAIVGGTFVFSQQWLAIVLTAASLLITLLWGRVFCGFVCSFGAMQDLLHLGGKHLSPKTALPPKADRVLKYLKYCVLLFIIVGVWALGLFGDIVWSPWTVFGAAASPWKGLPPLAVIFSVGGLLLLLTMIGSLFVERFFCKYLCPLGAVFAILSRFRVFKLRRNAEQCGERCRACTRRCSMSIPLYRYREVSSGECINCMKCTAVCPQGNIRADALPAVSGTVAAVALAGVCFVGSLPAATTVKTDSSAAVSGTVVETGRYRDGVYTGSANGFRGETTVQVTVRNGGITGITVISSADDRKFLSRAESQIIPAIIEAQDTDVAAVSGATFSSRGIINAVADALDGQLSADGETPTLPASQAQTFPADNDTADDPVGEQTEAPTESGEPETEEPDADEDLQSPQDGSGLADGVYYGSGSGLRGLTEVAVTVRDGVITDITVTAYQDDYPYFSRAQKGVIASILSSQSIDVSTVSGATFSSNSIIEAVADALGQEFVNPNSAMSGGRRH